MNAIIYWDTAEYYVENITDFHGGYNFSNFYLINADGYDFDESCGSGHAPSFVDIDYIVHEV